MNKKLIPVILAGTTLLSACNNATDTTSTQAAATPTVTIAKEDAVAVVNGTYISKASLAVLESEIAQRSQGQILPKEQLIEELVQRELLVQDAKQKQLDKTAEFSERLETIKTSLLSQASIQNYLKSNPITDAILKAEYDKNVSASGEEYKARHILVKTEDEAKAIIVELDKGADFSELAKTKSTGPSGPQGGDLGWFAAGQMVAPFSEAVIALENNKYTKTPVQTQFGWHVILREDSRAQTPPPFEAVKEQIRPQLQRQKMQEFLDSLRQQAKVEIFAAPVVEQTTAADQEVEVEIVDVEITDITDSSKETAEPAADASLEIKPEVIEAVEQTKADVSKTIDKTVDSAQATTKEVTKTVTDKVESTNKAISESVDKTADKASETLDALTK